MLVREGNVELLSKIQLIQIMLCVLLCSSLLGPFAAEAAAAFTAALIIEEPKLSAKALVEECPKERQWKVCSDCDQNVQSHIEVPLCVQFSVLSAKDR